MCYVTCVLTCDNHRSVELDGIHPRILRELVEGLTEPHSSLYQQSWQPRKAPGDWKLSNVTPTSKRPN